MTSLVFTVYGEARPQGSMKAFLPQGWRRPILTSDNVHLKSWRQLVQERANAAVADLEDAQRGPMVGGVRLTIAFYLPRPQSLPRRVIAHTRKPDIDKLVRAIFDALHHIVYLNDSQVCELVTAKYYADDGQLPHVDVRVDATFGLLPARVPAAPLPLFERGAAL